MALGLTQPVKEISKIKMKQTPYKPLQALRVPGGLGFQISK
jgi:hypothetical protein